MFKSVFEEYRVDAWRYKFPGGPMVTASHWHRGSFELAEEIAKSAVRKRYDYAQIVRIFTKGVVGIYQRKT